MECFADRADRLIRRLNGTVGSRVQDGCLEWLCANRPDLWNGLCAGENAVDRAYIAEDLAALTVAVEEMERLYLQAFDVYAARPPLMEVV